MTTIAVKPIWNGKDHDLDVIEDNPNLGALAQAGYLIYTKGQEGRILEDIRRGALLSHWPKRRLAAVVSYLEDGAEETTTDD